MGDTTAGRRTVRLADVPLDLYRRAQQYTDDLLRDLLLMADHERANGTPGAAARLADAAGDHQRLGAALRVEAAPGVDEARARGDRATTIEYAVEMDAADRAAAWSRVLDELDGMCRGGSLLAVPADDRVALFLRWFCGELVAQLRDGAPPCPWPVYEATATR